MRILSDRFVVGRGSGLFFAHQGSRRSKMKRLLYTAVAGVAAAVVLAGSASADKVRYAPTVTADTSGTPWLIGGCGYHADYGDVTLEVFSPVGAGWVVTHVGSDGCLVPVSNFASVGAGHYTIDAWQAVRNKSVVVAETAFDL